LAKKVVLAYSGGLDTSIIIPWLKENYQCEVVAMVGDVGQNEDLKAAEKKAFQTGASACYVEDLKTEFVREYIWPTLRSGAIYEYRYLLGTSMARPVLAKAQAEVAKRVGADALAHGCTGKGNDQVRFELGAYALEPDIQVIAPWREWNLTSREALMDFCEQHQIPVDYQRGQKSPYSMDANLLHISYEGDNLEDPWQAADEEMWRWTVAPEQAPDQAQIIEIEFRAGAAAGEATLLRNADRTLLWVLDADRALSASIARG